VVALLAHVFTQPRSKADVASCAKKRAWDIRALRPATTVTVLQLAALPSCATVARFVPASMDTARHFNDGWTP